MCAYVSTIIASTTSYVSLYVLCVRTYVFLASIPIMCVCPVCALAAVVLAGTAGSGKSVCIDTVVAVVNSLKHHCGEAAPVQVKLQRLYPVVFEDLSALFGQVTSEGDWKDGVFSALLRKALQVGNHHTVRIKFVQLDEGRNCEHNLNKK